LGEGQYGPGTSNDHGELRYSTRRGTGVKVR
jgi:hypothetical protein